MKAARKIQRIDNGIEVQCQVLAIPAKHWMTLYQALDDRALLTPKEISILKLAMQIPSKIPTEKQCIVLLGILEKAQTEGITVRE